MLTLMSMLALFGRLIGVKQMHANFIIVIEDVRHHLAHGVEKFCFATRRHFQIAGRDTRELGFRNGSLHGAEEARMARSWSVRPTVEART